MSEDAASTSTTGATAASSAESIASTQGSSLSASVSAASTQSSAASTQSSLSATQKSDSSEASTSGESITLSSSGEAVLQLDSFPEDILFTIFKRLDIQNRLNCAKVNKRWNKILKKWIDIRSIAISEKHFSIKNEFIESSVSFKVQDASRINPMVLMFLKKCSHAYHLVIHNAQVLKYFATIWSKFQNLELLVLPNDTFDELKFKDSSTLLHLLSNPKLQSLHILEHVKSFPSKKRIFAPLHISVMATKRLQIFHAHGIILGPLALEKMAEKFADSLQELRIGSVCVASADAERYWKAIAKFTKLKILELPPSLFSISRPLDTQHLPILSTFKNLESLAVFICPQGAAEVGLFLSHIPKTLQKLMVRTYSDELPENIVAALAQQKTTLIFLPKKAYSFRWPFKHSDGNYQLFLKGFWEPPYFPETELIGVNLTPEIIRAQTSNWQCILPDLAKFETDSMLVDVVETAKDKATDNLVTASASETGVATLRTARERSPNVEHAADENGQDTVQQVIHEMVDRVNGMMNEPNNGTAQGQRTPPREEATVRSTQSPSLNPPATPPMTVSATNIAPPSTQELPASASQPPAALPAATTAMVNASSALGQLQDGNSNYILSSSTPSTTPATVSSNENIPAIIGELQLDVTQQSDASPAQSVASISNISTASAQTASSGSSVGTGWFV